MFKVCQLLRRYGYVYACQGLCCCRCCAGVVIVVVVVVVVVVFGSDTVARQES